MVCLRVRGTTPIEVDANWALYNVSNEAENLHHMSLMATDAVWSIGIYPYSAESDCLDEDDW